jgi:uncharacterized membrane protein (DUF2068 family)
MLIRWMNVLPCVCSVRELHFSVYDSYNILGSEGVGLLSIGVVVVGVVYCAFEKLTLHF